MKIIIVLLAILSAILSAFNLTNALTIPSYYQGHEILRSTNRPNPFHGLIDPGTNQTELRLLSKRDWWDDLVYGICYSETFLGHLCIAIFGTDKQREPPYSEPNSAERMKVRGGNEAEN